MKNTTIKNLMTTLTVSGVLSLMLTNNVYSESSAAEDKAPIAYFTYMYEDCASPNRPYEKGMDIADDFLPMVLPLYHGYEIDFLVDFKGYTGDNAFVSIVYAGNKQALKQASTDWHYSVENYSPDPVSSFSTCFEMPDRTKDIEFLKSINS